MNRGDRFKVSNSLTDLNDGLFLPLGKTTSDEILLAKHPYKLPSLIYCIWAKPKDLTEKNREVFRIVPQWD